MMPGSSGFYAIEKIRVKNKNAFIIAVTADVSSQTSGKLKELHVNHTAYKPIDMNQIVKFIENI